MEREAGAEGEPVPDVGEPGDVGALTAMVRDLARGQPEAGLTLLPYLLSELRGIAAGHLRHQRPGHTLQASALVNEVYLKLFVPEDAGGDQAGEGGELAELEVNDRQHFFALAARAMRQVLVDHARRRASAKRGGDSEPVSLSVMTAETGKVGDVGAGVDLDVLDLNVALEELGELDERQARIVELRFFGGLSEADIAQLLDLSRSTVQREWRMARAWLGTRLQRDRKP